MLKCDDHNKDYTFYCKSCNVPICEKCKTTTHSSHKKQPMQDAANCMRTELRVLIEGLKSKLPYIDNFIDNAKAEETKYWSHIQQTETEMKSAAANLKEMLCKSVDLFLVQNLALPNSDSLEYKKFIQTYIKDAERDKMSIVNLIKASEDTDRFSDDYTLLTTGNALCRQIGLCERTCFQSELKINSPLYQAGNISYGPIRDFIGFVRRKNVSVVNLKLQLPIMEMPRYSTSFNIECLTKIQLKTQKRCYSICAIGADTVQVSQLGKYTNKGEIQQMTIDGSVLWTAEVIVDGEERFKIIHTQMGKSYVMCANLLKIVESIKSVDSQTYTFKIADAEITINDIVCRLDKRNFLVFNYNYKIFSVVDNSFSKTARKFKISPPTTDVSDPKDMMVTTSKFILISMKQEILVCDLAGELKYAYSANESDFRSICSDCHDNVFVADFNKNRVCLFTSDGHFVRNVLTSVHGISNPISIIIDGCGNLWVLMDNKTVSVFSFV